MDDQEATELDALVERQQWTRERQDPDQPYRCVECGALCDHRIQVCECGPDCPLPPVQR